MSSNTYFCVLSTPTGNILYAGTSEAATAAKLDPGTVYGYGRTRRMAWLMAIKQRADILRMEGSVAGTPEYVEPEGTQP